MYVMKWHKVAVFLHLEIKNYDLYCDETIHRL